MLGLLVSSIVPVFAVAGSETVTYTYDARGRLVQVSRSGSVNNGVQATYTYDRADNRTVVTVSGAGGGTPNCGGISFIIASNAAVTEGTNSVFTISKAGSTSNSCSVNYATANGSATAGSDYTAASGTLTFTSAQTSKSVSVVTADDTSVESAETFTMSLSSPTDGSTVGTPGTATATINDNDSSPPPSFSISDGNGTEGGLVSFTIIKSGSTSSSFTVTFATANGTALAYSDYSASSGMLTFAANETTKTVNIATIDNLTVEDTETFVVNLSSPSGGSSISDGQGIGTIFDNDDGGSTCPPDCDLQSFPTGEPKADPPPDTSPGEGNRLSGGDR